ncbi:SRPBCC family protein [uncultured Flavobacterium sp.]|uniref:SRPBCC family protein n=1 Tax=uncultured Flavobacterium sp. TaxID=165435 RepID=UPI0025FC6FDD|nr:SRPBCC family protein [uncultured Flavobacterium sp.]
MGLTQNPSKQNFSKYDPSGTDPNRYASVSNEQEADSYLHKYKKSIVPGLRVNIGKTERIFMVAAGAYLLYRALAKKDDKKILEGVAAGTMLFRGISGYCPAYDLIERSGRLQGGNISITTSLSVDKPVDEVYNAWRQLQNLPLFMDHLHSVAVIDNYKSEWKAKLPAGIGTVSWTAEILMDEPNKLLSWHSMPGSAIDNAGKVRFKDNGSSTDIEVTISYHAPMGKAGEIAGSLLTPVFEKMIHSDIENFKKYIEVGTAPAH